MRRRRFIRLWCNWTKTTREFLGQRIFGQRCAVLGEMSQPFWHHLAELPRRPPYKQCGFSFHHLAQSMAEGFSKQELDLKRSHRQRLAVTLLTAGHCVCPLSKGNVNCATPSVTQNFGKGDPNYLIFVHVCKWGSQSLLSKVGPFERKGVVINNYIRTMDIDNHSTYISA